jgi:hypothetical protein
MSEKEKIMLRQCMKVFMAATLALMCQLALAQVAVIDALTGTAQAIPGAGAPRALKKGDNVNQGETVTTGAASSVVLRFEDGQVVALTANARMAISSYVYNKAEPAKSNMLLNLAQGGMRAITGLIGKAKPSNVAYRAGNATIGIRGTDLEVGVAGDDLYVVAESGEAEVELEGKLAVALASGQPFAMTLPVALPDAIADSAQGWMLAQTANQRMLVNSTNALLRTAGTITTASPSTIVRLTASLRVLQAIAAQTSNPTFKNEVNQTIQRVQAFFNQSQQGQGQQGQQGQGQQGQGQPGNTGSPGSGSGSGGGGSLPACSTISQVSARQPGVNCTN